MTFEVVVTETAVGVVLVIVTVCVVPFALVAVDCLVVVLNVAVVFSLSGVEILVLVVGVVDTVIGGAFLVVAEIVVIVVLLVSDGVFEDFDIAVVRSVRREDIVLLPVSLSSCPVVFVVALFVTTVGEALLFVGVVEMFMLVADDCLCVPFDVADVLSLRGVLILVLLVSLNSGTLLLKVDVSETAVFVVLLVVVVVVVLVVAFSDGVFVVSVAAVVFALSSRVDAVPPDSLTVLVVDLILVFVEAVSDAVLVAVIINVVLIVLLDGVSVFEDVNAAIVLLLSGLGVLVLAFSLVFCGVLCVAVVVVAIIADA